MTATEIIKVVELYLKEYGFAKESYKGNYINCSQFKNWQGGLKKTDPTGEEVWRKRAGAFYSPLFIKLEAEDGFAHLEAWGLSRTVPNNFPFPFAPRVGEGVLETPGLKRCLKDIQSLLNKGGEVPKGPIFVPEFVWRRGPYGWQGWVGILSVLLITIILVSLQGSVFKGMLMATIAGVLFCAIVAFCYIVARD